METRTITIQKNTPWEKETQIVLTKKWDIVHAKSRTKAGNAAHIYTTREACLKGCKQIIKNNNPDTVQRFFPEGVDAAPFWCYPNGQIHSHAETIPIFIDLRLNKKTGNYQWSIYNVREKPVWMNDGDPSIEKVKTEALEVFPAAKFNELLP